jgi:nitric oxide reductase subunit C
MSRLFFIACFVVSALIAAVIIAKGFAVRDVPENVSLGYAIWQNNGCVGCHTLYGQGGAYAPDLTHIYSQRGEGYIREFLVNPSAFHPNQRVMPRFDLTVSETDNLMAFLGWVDTQPEAAMFPPRAILVSGGGMINSSTTTNTSDQSVEDSPVGRGRALFSSSPALCSTCHSVEPDVVNIGPSLYGIAERGATRIPNTSAEAYIRNSILHPSDYIVDGFTDSMQKNFGDVLTSQEIDDLIAFLMTLGETSDDN